MERRISSRAHVDLPVSALVDGFQHACRAVDISASGMVLERTRSLSERTAHELNALELRLPRGRAIPMHARTVWSRGRMQAVRFVVIHDVDRLDIAEHLDEVARRQT